MFYCVTGEKKKKHELEKKKIWKKRPKFKSIKKRKKNKNEMVEKRVNEMKNKNRNE